MEPEIDLVADLNSEDDDGLGWSSLSDARDAAQVRPWGDAGRGQPLRQGSGPGYGRRRGRPGALHCAPWDAGEESPPRRPSAGLSENQAGGTDTRPALGPWFLTKGPLVDVDPQAHPW